MWGGNIVCFALAVKGFAVDQKVFLRSFPAKHSKIVI